LAVLVHLCALGYALPTVGAVVEGAKVGRLDRRDAREFARALAAVARPPFTREVRRLLKPGRC
jgi:hypothetical protein